MRRQDRWRVVGSAASRRVDRGRDRVNGNAGNRVTALGVEIYRVSSGNSRSGSAGVCLISSRAGNRNRGSGRSANGQNSRR
ncbi:hypothetical protein DSL72_004985 [Monilinia vaccinii-corymbosi]|uniref:Uncharacterized protein n=1 Tax=Monilinia vaccinii-corymbosi TaxID=61207 RepID=A0A8A3PDZ1_9HELO|nr:hypothetical protein DSL72_004985 [Monilinia vaccinii-corymbosi]